MSGNINCAMRNVQVRKIMFAARKPRHEISVNILANKMAFPVLEHLNSTSYILRACFRIYPVKRQTIHIFRREIISTKFMNHLT